MPTFRVTGPDGKTYNVTGPDGSTAEQALARVKSQVSANPKTPTGFMDKVADYLPGYGGTIQSRAAAQKSVRSGSGGVKGTGTYGLPAPKSDLTSSYLRGGTFGGLDEVSGLTGALADAVRAPFTDGNYDFGRSYEAWKARARQQAAATDAAHPVLSPVMMLAGGLGRFKGGLSAPTSLPKAIVKGSAIGGGVGALSGFLEGDGLYDRATKAKTGLELGTVLGASLPAALPLVVKGAGAAKNAVQTAYRGIRGIPMPDKAAEIARNAIANRLAADMNTPQQAGQIIDEAAGNGVPLSLMDTGDNMRALGSYLTRQPGTSRTMMKAMLQGRQAEAGDRVRGAIQRDLGPIENPFEVTDGLMMKAVEDSAPLYGEAFNGGSLAPLEKQFEGAFNESSAAVNAAKRELQAARNGVTFAGSKQATAGMNVYGNSAANREARAASDAVSAAQAKLDQATAQHEGNLARLRQAQADGTANAPGAVWSPRIQQFLDDPISKAGLAKGIEVQRLEALAEGRPFNPTEYAIIGMGEDGAPIVGSVPNMRTLDSVKRGLYEMLDAYPRDINGKLQLDQRGRAIDMVRKSLLKHLDDLNPTYGAARAAYAGPVSAKDAFVNGRNALHFTAEEMDRATSRLTGHNREQFANGFRSALSDALRNSGDTADLVRKILGTDKKRRAIAKLFGGEAGLSRFLKTMEAEAAARESYGTILGSPSGQRIAEDFAGNADMQGLGPVAGNLLRGRPVAAALDAARGAWQFGIGKTADEARNQAAALISQTDGNALRDIIAETARQNAARLARQQALRRAGILGAVPAGQLSGRQ